VSRASSATEEPQDRRNTRNPRKQTLTDLPFQKGRSLNMEMTTVSEDTNDDHESGAHDGAIDEAIAKADIAAGARALRELKRTAGDRWTKVWSPAVRGWRGLRELVFLRIGMRDTRPQAYRDTMKALLAQPENVEYREILDGTRAAMTRLIAHIDQVDDWHATLDMWTRDRWTNPQTIVKNCPRHLLTGPGHNLPKRGPGKKKKGNPEAESLRAAFIRVITKFVMPVDPEEAKRLLEALYRSDPNDAIDDIGEDDDDGGEEA
jgi:hypothetical protein